MARIARIAIPGLAHFVTQRGYENRQVFFSSEDFEAYRKLVAESCEERQVKVIGYCLMPNHVRVVAIPSTTEGLARAFGEAHRRYAKVVNGKLTRAGKLWHARFSSCALEEAWTPKALRYIERFPLDSGLVLDVGDYAWTSVAANLGKAGDPIVKEKYAGLPADWLAFLKQPNDPAEIKLLLAHERTGRPLGSLDFVKSLEEQLGKRIQPKKRGRKPKVRPQE